MVLAYLRLDVFVSYHLPPVVITNGERQFHDIYDRLQDFLGILVKAVDIKQIIGQSDDNSILTYLIHISLLVV